MTITFPIEMPNVGDMERFALFALSSAAMLRSPWTFATQVQEHQGDMWAAEVSVKPMARADAAYWDAFLTQLRGPYGTFYLGDPNGRTPRGVATGNPKVILGGQTGFGLGTKGWTPDVTGILKAGDYIQVGTRLYKVMADADSDALGNCNLEIWPKLRESPALDTVIETEDCVGLFRLDQAEVQPFEVDRELLYTISFTAVEAL